MVELKNINFSYENIPLFLDLNLKVSVGEITTLVGNSGVGKSTLIKIILGLIKPHSGQVFSHNNFGYVPQNLGLIPHLRVEKNILLGREKNEKFKYYVEQLNIKSILKKYPREISGGQAQRVAIIRAILNSPK